MVNSTSPPLQSLEGGAGIVATRRATLATRNLRHFRDLGIAMDD